MSSTYQKQNAYKSKDEWLTPPYIIKELGKFDLDPCAPVARYFETAKKYYTKLDNGLSKEWAGRVWLNPPYGKEAEKWISKLSEHNNGIALLFARTETKMFFDYVWGKADAIFFIRGRLRFYHANGTCSNSATAPSCLIAYGKNNVEALININKKNIDGKLLIINGKTNE